MTFLTILGVTEILCSFRLESTRLEFLKYFSVNNFALSNAEGSTSGTLNREGMADLPLIGMLLAIRQKSREPSF